jgi:hypothetical protein
MVKLEAANCQLKRAQVRQLQSWLKRSVQLGERVGDFILTITIRRVGRVFAMHANVHDSAGDFGCRARGQTWRDVCRAIVRMLSVQLHNQRLKVAMG